MRKLVETCFYCNSILTKISDDKLRCTNCNILVCKICGKLVREMNIFGIHRKCNTNCIECGKIKKSNRGLRCRSCAELIKNKEINPRCGISLFNSWKEKFGEIKATELEKQRCRKIVEHHMNNTQRIYGGYKRTIYKGYYLRSSYEYTRALFLDSIDAIWTYEEKFYELGDTYYIPDFHIYDESGNLLRIEEVKCKYSLTKGRDKIVNFLSKYKELAKIYHIVLDDMLSVDMSKYYTNKAKKVRAALYE